MRHAITTAAGSTCSAAAADSQLLVEQAVAGILLWGRGNAQGNVAGAWLKVADRRRPRDAHYGPRRWYLRDRTVARHRQSEHQSKYWRRPHESRLHQFP